MKTRAEAVELIHRQLESQTDATKVAKTASHYGMCELRELMDFIYEGGPSSGDEEILGYTARRNRRKPTKSPLKPPGEVRSKVEEARMDARMTYDPKYRWIW